MLMPCDAATQSSATARISWRLGSPLMYADHFCMLALCELLNSAFALVTNGPE